MAAVEQILNEAQYAFNSISSGDSPDNKRNSSRAASLCKKIIRRFPDSTEAAEAHAILKRLGEEAFTSNISIAHRHTTQAEHHAKPTPVRQTNSMHDVESELLDWSGLLSLMFKVPKTVLGLIAFFGIILFGILGPFLFLPLIALMLFTGPGRQLLNPKQRQGLNAFVTKANIYINKRR